MGFARRNRPGTNELDIPTACCACRAVGVDFLILLPQLKLGSTTSAVENIYFATSSPQHLPFMAFTIVFTLKEGPLRCGVITDRNKNKNREKKRLIQRHGRGGHHDFELSFLSLLK